MGSKIELFKGQKYGRLKRKFMDSKELFTDPLFPANDHSLNLNRRDVATGRVVWKRPSEICEAPRLFVDKASCHDVTQGRLGNCWLVAACSALATCKPLWSQVVPDYKLQDWDPVRPEQYAGIFRFRFWRTGKWIEVVVDDYLPTLDDELVFCHSNTKGEFWSALLEKAYAKLCGSYGSMEGGNLCDALVDFTSGLGEMINLRQGYDQEDTKDELRKTLVKESEDHAMMCCAIGSRDPSMFETRTRTGLIVGHAYTITDVKVLHVNSSGGLMSLFRSGEKITLVRIRNPWGAKEWNGAFSDGTASGNASVVNGIQKSMGQANGDGGGASMSTPKRVYLYSADQLTRMTSRSAEWSTISKSERNKLGLTVDDDGEFWMPFDDFVTEFTDICICRLINTSFFSFKKSWYESCISGEWTSPHHAGGCSNHPTFLKNPQYVFDVPHTTMEVQIQILQADLRGRAESNPRGELEYKSIGFHIMKVEANREYRVHKLQEKAAASDYVKSRSVFFRGTLNKGRHVLVPTTFEPHIMTEFMVRMYTDCKVHVKELKYDYPEPYWCSKMCCGSVAPAFVTVVTVEGASGLSHEMDSFCVVKVEGKKLKSAISYKTTSPSWDLKGIFYRKDVCEPFTIEIYEHGMFKDKIIGNAIISGRADNHINSLRVPIISSGKAEGKVQSGDVNVVVATYDEPDAA